MPTLASVTLVLGGARSGKSRYAESLVTTATPPWTYIATAQAGDGEMATRIAAHRSRRGGQWKTVEAPRDLAGALATPDSSPHLVDCLTLWLSNIMLANADIEAEVVKLESALRATSVPIVLVSNEVGSGIVPDNALARQFRDWQGILNQRIATLATRVVLVVAGLPMIVKGEP
ncbi:MAG: bifunctional adenosylcobinamide kinase/adenosylcobinamide-phosphate guanylyltransferase [Pseudolabrys sp.]